MSESLIEARGLTKKYSGRTVFADLTFSLLQGASLALTGPSGSGKTTLLNCLGLLDSVDCGALQLAGVDARKLSAGRRRHLLRSTVGHLFQHYGLVESWSVSRNLDVGLIGQGLTRPEREARRRAALERVGLGGIHDSRTHVLSGGEQQRLALARLIVKSPRIVVADEPTAALDAENVELVFSVLGDMAASGCALVIATHDVGLESWCDERLNLRDFGG